MSYVVHWRSAHGATLYHEQPIPDSDRANHIPLVGNGPAFESYATGHDRVEDAFLDYLYWASHTALQCAMLGIEGTYHQEIAAVLDLADQYYRGLCQMGYWSIELGTESSTEDEVRAAWMKHQPSL